MQNKPFTQLLLCIACSTHVYAPYVLVFDCYAEFFKELRS
jgi:hypothetical protein